MGKRFCMILVIYTIFCIGIHPQNIMADRVFIFWKSLKIMEEWDSLAQLVFINCGQLVCIAMNLIDIVHFDRVLEFYRQIWYFYWCRKSILQDEKKSRDNSLKIFTNI